MVSPVCPDAPAALGRTNDAKRAAVQVAAAQRILNISYLRLGQLKCRSGRPGGTDTSMLT